MKKRDSIFDSTYVRDDASTSGLQDKSSLKEFLNDPIKKEELKEYGTSKPRRVLVKAIVTND